MFGLDFLLYYLVVISIHLICYVLSITQCMKHDSNDVKQIAAMLLAFLPACVAEPLDSNTLKVVLPSIVNGVKEKNTIVRSNCELAVVEMLQLRNDDDKTLQVGI